MASMAERITLRLDGDMELLVPTVVVMVAMTSFLLGLVFFVMGIFRVTSIANYMPYPGASRAKPISCCCCCGDYACGWCRMKPVNS